MPTDTNARPWARIGMWLVIVLAFGNALLYTLAVCNPLIGDDNWTFVDTFLRHALQDGVQLGDFLVKRAGVDHAQPLNKLLMLLNTRWFGLDFAIEGVAGLVFGLAALVVLVAMTVSDTPAASRPPVFYALMAAGAAVWFSLNSSMVYSFSLVTMGFSAFLSAFLCIWATWHALRTGRWWPLLVAMLAYGVIGDDSAIIAALALSLLALAWGWRTGGWKPAGRAILVMALAIVACRVFYATFGEIRGSTLPEFNVSLASRIAGLAAQWHDAWQWFAIPTASGLASAPPLHALLGAHWAWWQGVLGAALLVAHAWFWRTAWKAPTRAGHFLAAALMLLFYAYLAGLLSTRIFVRGTQYLHQPRYVSFYQLNIVALLVMAAAQSLAAGALRLRRWAWAPALAVLLLQVPLSISAWREAPWIQRYEVQMAAQWSAITLDPLHPPATCMSALAKLCAMPPAGRAQLLALLRDARINLFAPRFAMAHPALAQAAAPALALADRERASVPATAPR